jgi:hypothetical protein
MLKALSFLLRLCFLFSYLWSATTGAALLFGRGTQETKAPLQRAHSKETKNRKKQKRRYSGRTPKIGKTKLQDGAESLGF